MLLATVTAALLLTATALAPLQPNTVDQTPNAPGPDQATARLLEATSAATPWTKLLDKDPWHLADHLAQRLNLTLDQRRCDNAAQPEQQVSTRILPGEKDPTSNTKPLKDFDPETAPLVAALLACVTHHGNQLPTLEPGATATPREQTQWLSTLNDLLPLIQDLLQAPRPGFQDGVSCLDPRCLVQFGGPSDDHYQRPAMLIVDEGGNDTYHNDPAGAGPLTGDPSSGQPPVLISIVIDKGNGNDRYYGANGTTASVGAGDLGGFGFLVDGGGQDRFTALGKSLASGIAGFGMILSMGGDDAYLSHRPPEGLEDPGHHQKHVIAAASYGGIAIIDDRGGRDVYLQHGVDAIGYGALGGTGFLIDRAGNDRYHVRPENTTRALHERAIYISGVAVGVGELGGTGVLLDQAGDDKYRCDGPTGYGCIGASGEGSLGLLYDGIGDDRYLLGNQSPELDLDLLVGGLGAGDSNGVGLLWDVEGDDAYRSWHEASGGFGTGAGLGVLLDEGGGDSYHFPLAPLVGSRGDGEVWFAAEDSFVYDVTGLGVDRCCR